MEVCLRVAEFEDRTAGPTVRLPETDLRLHFFLSEHLERADARRLHTLYVPRQLGSEVRLRARLPPPPDGALSRAAAVGVRMYARSRDASGRRFLVPVGGALIMLSELDEGIAYDVDLVDYCDRGAPEGQRTVKGRLVLECTRLLMPPLRAEAEWWEAVPENRERLQAYAEDAVQRELLLYTEMGLVPASRSVQHTHVVRYQTETSGRQLPAVYFLARALWCVPRVQREYWECALRCALELLQVGEAEYTGWALDLPQKAAVLCTAAALYGNAGVLYVNDHTNRAMADGQGHPRRQRGAIIDIERFMDPMMSRGGDCEDVATLGHWLLKFLHQEQPGGSPLLQEAHRCLALYVPVCVIGEAVRPDAPPRASIEDYPPGERLGHFYSMLVPVRFMLQALRRAGETGLSAPCGRGSGGDGGGGARTEPLVSEGTTFQIGLTRAYEQYSAEQAPGSEAGVRRAREGAAQCVRRARTALEWNQQWRTVVDVADSPPFYGRLVKLMSDVFHPQIWSMAVAYTDGTYGVSMEDFVGMSADVALHPLVLQTEDMGRVAADALAQCEPVLMPLPGDGQVEVTDERLRALMPAMDAPARAALLRLPRAQCVHGSFFERQVRHPRVVWPLDQPPTLRELESLREAAPAYRGYHLRLLHVSAGLSWHGASGSDDVGGRAVGILVVDMCVEETG